MFRKVAAQQCTAATRRPQLGREGAETLAAREVEVSDFTHRCIVRHVRCPPQVPLLTTQFVVL